MTRAVRGGGEKKLERTRMIDLCVSEDRGFVQERKMRMKKFLFSVLTLGFGFIIGTAALAVAAEKDVERVIRVATPGTYAPFTMYDEATQEWSGFEIEFWRAVGEKSGYDIQFVRLDNPATFAELAYSGSLTRQLPVFLKVIVIVLIGHFIWMTLLYLIGGAVSKKNPLEVVKHYGPAYATAVGTMSSAATLPVALRCAHKSSVLPADIVDFAIPLGATTHLCGSVLTETFFAMTISQMLYGSVPSIGTMVLFSFLFGVFAVGAPGVPGGTVMASLGIVISVLGFNEIGTGLLIAIFALQDSFGTACNVTGDGALALILRGVFYKPDGTLKQA